MNDDLSVQLDRARNLIDELTAALRDMYSAMDNGHAVALTHADYKELIARGEKNI